MNFKNWYLQKFASSCELVADYFSDYIAISASEIGVDWQKSKNNIAYNGSKFIAKKQHLLANCKHEVAIYASAETKYSIVNYPVITMLNKGGAGDKIVVSCLSLLWEEYKKHESEQQFDNEYLHKKIEKINQNKIIAEKKLALEEAEKSENVSKELQDFLALDRTFYSSYAHVKNIDDIFSYIEVKRGVNNKGNYICIALRNIKNELVGIQKIYDDGKKEFTWGMKKKGAFAVIGRVAKSKTIYFCEGLATGASVYLATKERNTSVVVALDVYNLRAVVADFVKLAPSHSKIIACDNDYKKEKNVGLSLAQEIAKEFNLQCKYPVFKQGEDGSDWNDLHVLVGFLAVKQQIL
jgi:putative DNA primase/helicase